MGNIFGDAFTEVKKVLGLQAKSGHKHRSKSERKDVVDLEPVVMPEPVTKPKPKAKPKPVKKAKPVMKPKPVAKATPSTARNLKDIPLSGVNLARAKARLARKLDTNWEER